MRLDAERRRVIEKEDKESQKQEEAKQQSDTEADQCRQEQATTGGAGQQQAQVATIAEAATTAHEEQHQAETEDQRRVRMTKAAEEEAKQMKEDHRKEKAVRQHEDRQAKIMKEMKAKASKVVIKEIRFGPNTDDHDFDFKLKHAKKFLEDGAKLKAFVFFKGRSILFKDKGEILLLRCAQELEDFGKVEQLPKLEGKRMIMFISPKKK